MKQTLIKECDGCGLGYYKPWYEPMWLAHKNYAEAHETYHGNSQRDYGKKLEQERIIKLLEGEKFILPEGIDEGLTLMPIQEAIALIKREK